MTTPGQLRGAILKAVYEEWKRQGFQTIVGLETIMDQIGVDQEDARREAEYLAHKGLLRSLDEQGLSFMPTAAGIDYIEHPEQFPALGTTIIISAPRTYGDITVSGGHVTFGDGASINITSVTFTDLVRALEGEIEAKVSDPQEKKSLLGYLAGLTKNPSFTTFLQVTLPELLKRIPGLS